MKITPKKKAAITTLFFAIIGIIGWFFLATDWLYSLPLGIFYATLTLNTYFSIVLFSKIIPQNSKVQNLFDGLLVLSFIGLALGLGNVTFFIFFDLVLFVFATTKYAFMLNKTNHPKLMKRKILVDLFGVFGATFTIGNILLGYETNGVWLLTIAFVFVNIIIFSIWPLYKLDTYDVTV